MFSTRIRTTPTTSARARIALVCILAGCLLPGAFLPGGPGAKTWVIFPDGSGDAPTIAAAFDSAAMYDSVLAMPGIHYEHDLNLPMWVALIGLDAETTVIDAQGKGRVMSCVLPNDDFTICGIVSVTLRGGKADRGGGLYVVGSLAATLALEIRWIIVEENEAELDGGGVYSKNAAVRMKSSTVRGNVAHGRGGGIAAEGTNSVRFGVSVGYPLPGYLLDNEAAVGGAVWSGEFARVDVDRVVVAGNRAWEKGGAGAVADRAVLSVSRATIVGNGAPEGSVLYRGPLLPDGSAGIGASIMAFNTGGDIILCEGNPPVEGGTCNAVFGNEGGDGCFHGSETLRADPLLCDPDDGDYTLREDSPCLEENVPDSLDCPYTIGVFEVPGCMAPPPTRTESTTWGQIKIRYNE
jgi:hypothetical protein